MDLTEHLVLFCAGNVIEDVEGDDASNDAAGKLIVMKSRWMNLPSGTFDLAIWSWRLERSTPT